MHSNETSDESAKNTGEIVRKPGNEDLRAKINRMLASLPHEQASIVRERFDLTEEETPPLEDFARVLQDMAPDVIWQRYDPLKATNLFELHLLAELYHQYLYDIGKEAFVKARLKFPL
jgi:hypothetical protein